MQAKKNVLDQSPPSPIVCRPSRSIPSILPAARVSLKQWRILHTVIDCGGFAEAAKFLHLSQSAVSYTLSKLQDQLGVQILRIEGRRAVLTAEGQDLLEKSRHVLKEAIELEHYARHMDSEVPEEVRLAVDHNFPTNVLMAVLRKFMQPAAAAFHVQVDEVNPMQIEDIMRKREVDLVISERVPLGFRGEPLVEVEYIAVAHPDSPLARASRTLTKIDLARHVQIGVGYAGGFGGNAEPKPGCMYRWNMKSFETVVQAVCEGLGYAWLPVHRIQEWLSEGKLVQISIADRKECTRVLHLVHGRPWAAGGAVNLLAEALRNHAPAGLKEKRRLLN